MIKDINNHEGINRYVADNELKYNDYKNVLFKRSHMRHCKDKD